MKRVQMFLAGAFIAVGSLCAQSTDAEWQAEVAKLKGTIQTNPAQAAEEAEHLIKGIRIWMLTNFPKRKNMQLLPEKRMVNRLLLLYWKEILP